MGQIIGSAAKPKRCNINQLSQLGTPAAGEYILVSSNNSMNAAGQGNFDCYIVGNGTKAATALELHKFKAEELDEQLNGVTYTSAVSNYVGGLIITSTTITSNTSWNTYYVSVQMGQEFNVEVNSSNTTCRWGFCTSIPANGVAVSNYTQGRATSELNATTFTAPFHGYFLISMSTSYTPSMSVVFKHSTPLVDTIAQNVSDIASLQSQVTENTENINFAQGIATWIVGSYVNTSGVVKTNASYMMTKPMHLYNGQSLRIQHSNGAGLALVSSTDSEGSSYTPLVVGSRTELDVTYEIETDGYYCVSAMATGTTLTINGANDRITALEQDVVDLENLANGKILNVSAKYPTSGIDGTFYYDLDTAVAQVTEDVAEQGLILMFRAQTAIYASYVRIYILTGVATGSADVWYHNAANYRPIVLKDDTFDVSYIYPNDGDYNDGRYSLYQAIVKVPATLRYHAQKIRFKNIFGLEETWMFTGTTASQFVAFNATYWRRIDVLMDYLGDCDNRLANPLYETFEHYNTQHSDSPITAITVHPLNNSDNVKRRIPICIITNAGTYLTACQKQDNAGGDFGHFSIEVSRKTTNGIWTSSVVVPYVSESTTWRCNTSFLVERDNSQGHQGRIYLFFGSFSDVVVWWEQTTATSDFNYIYSDDDGVTWSGIQSLKSEWDTDIYKFTIPSCTNGIQLKNGTLVVPCMCVEKDSDTQSMSHILYKTVSGDWTFSAVIPTNRPYEKLDECAIVEAEDNVVNLIPRNQHSWPTMYPWDSRYIYNFGNDSWSEIQTTFFEKQSCCFSIDKIVEGSKTIYLRSDIDPFDGRNGRTNVTIWASLDLNTWIRVYRAYKPAGNGYSVISCYDGNIIIVYELSTTIQFQDISLLKQMLVDSSTFLSNMIGVQDRLQLLFNYANGIE